MRVQKVAPSLAQRNKEIIKIEYSHEFFLFSIMLEAIGYYYHPIQETSTLSYTNNQIIQYCI